MLKLKSNNSVFHDYKLQLLLGYLPTSRDLWEKELNESRLKYNKLKEEFLRKPVSCITL